MQDGSGSVTIYYLGGLQGATVLSTAAVTASNPWIVVGAGDFNGDGNPDLVWQDPVHGSVQIWYLQNNVLVSSLDLTVNNTWLVASVADFNQDGHPDLIWQDPVTGIAQVWFMTGAEGTTLLSTADISKSNTWRIVGPR